MRTESALQIENRNLRGQLQALLAEARLNEQKMHRFAQFERRLIGTRSLEELIQILLRSFKAVFEHDVVTLALIDPEYEITRILEEGIRREAKMDGLALLESPDILTKLYRGDFRPVLGTFDAQQHGALFAPLSGDCASVALLPVMNQGELVGSLNLGSYTAERFVAGHGTDFLERLTAIFAICLENALNHHRLKRVGLTDTLTGINNRRYFESRCLEEITHAQRHCLPLACMFMDVDKFKRINSDFGHQSGDKVLHSVAGLIKLQLRANDVIARYGGEEFIVLLPQTDLVQACDIAERVRSAVSIHPFQVVSGENIQVTISIGISMLGTETAGKDVNALAEGLVMLADEALHQAKEEGRNRVICREA